MHCSLSDPKSQVYTEYFHCSNVNCGIRTIEVTIYSINFEFSPLTNLKRSARKLSWVLNIPQDLSPIAPVQLQASNERTTSL